MRITDDISLLNWIPHFAMQFLNKMRTGRRWRQSMAQFGEEELISFVKCIIQRILVGHHDRTRAISYIIKSGIVRGKSRTRQTLSDAWESTFREDLFGNPWHRRLPTAIAETKLTKKSLLTKKERIFYCQECWSRNLFRVSVEDSTFCGYRSSRTHWKWSGMCVAYFAWTSDETT